MVRHVVDTLVAGGVLPQDIRVVVGHERAAVALALDGAGIVCVFNEHYTDGSMLRSLQTGLASLADSDLAGALAVLGDQPQIQVEVVRRVIATWKLSPTAVLAPSYGQKRGHPILFSRDTWPAVLGAEPVGSPREVLGLFSGQIAFLELPDDATLRDIDTPDDYARELKRRV